MTTIKTFGDVDLSALAQLERCMDKADYGVLCADHHKGYSQPIGGAIAYRDYISPSGVGYDIACGNKAAKTNIKATEIDVPAIMEEIWRVISFGVGRNNIEEQVDDAVLDIIAHAPFKPQRQLVDLASKQLGTVGSGNHYVDLFEDEEGWLWIGAHFGSRGFGHRTATGFLALANGLSFEDKATEGEMDSPPILIKADSELGQDYIAAMHTAGEYAYSGRNWVVGKVAQIIGAEIVDEVHNHHNFAWRETHFGAEYWVIRKGCTPAFPGQRGFVGGSMGDISVILEGVESTTAQEALYSTVHGAGRIMSRTQAAGKKKWLRDEVSGKKLPQIVSPGLVDWDAVRAGLSKRGIVLKGGGADEAPEVYKRLPTVLEAQGNTIRILHTLKPLGVAMAGIETFDPYKD